MFGLPELALALMAWYLLGAPILFYFRYKVQAYPTIENCDPSVLPEAVRENFDQRFAEFSNLQFHHFGTFTMPQAIKDFKSLFAVYENEQLNVTAVTSALFVKVRHEWRLKHQIVEIGSRFSDGVEIDTANVNAILMYPSRPGWVRTQHPELQSVPDLFKAHMCMVEHHRKGRVSISELKKNESIDVLAYYSNCVHETLSRAEMSGYLRLKNSQFEGTESAAQPHSNNPYKTPVPDLIDQGAVFVPTFIGAFKMMWQILWPMKPILLRIRIARDRKLLAETGFQWP